MNESVGQRTRQFLVSLGLPPGDSYDLPDSLKRFPDGGQYRLEIPSVEGPAALQVVIEEAARYGLTIQRVSQGSGIMMLTDAEIRQMAELGCAAKMEVSLFVGPRAAWDTGAQITAAAGKNLGARLRGMDQVIYAAEDIRRACDLGIRSVLIADEGLLWLVTEMKKKGELPSNLVTKISVQMGAANPISVRWMEQLGAGTYNVPTDLSLPQLAALRQAASLPFDVYVEVPDDGGDLGSGETYFLMPWPDRTMRPLRMKQIRRLTLGEYRMSHLTAVRMSEKLDGTSEIMDDVHLQILGPEIISETE